MKNKTLKIIKEFDKKQKNIDFSLIEKIVFSSTKENPINFIMFTCSTIDAKYMFSNSEFDKYVKFDPTGNNITDDLETINQFISILNETNASYKLTIIIGNTDPYYIYSQQLDLLPGITKQEYFKRMNNRWIEYKKNFSNWIKETIKENERIEIISWYEFEQNINVKLKWDFETLFDDIKKKYKNWFDENDLRWELEKLVTHFGEGKYFENLAKPEDEILKKWVISKFSEYAVQGFWLSLFFPNAILIQNEKPTDLRYKMYQPLIKKYLNSGLPNIYPFGIDNSGYQ